MEFFFAAVELLLAAQHNLGASLNRMYRSANVNGLANQALNIANGFFVLAGIDNKKMAVGIRCLWATHIEKMNVVRRIDHPVDMRRNADVFIGVPQRILRCDTSVLLRCEGGQHCGKDQ